MMKIKMKNLNDDGEENQNRNFIRNFYLYNVLKFKIVTCIGYEI